MKHLLAQAITLPGTDPETGADTDEIINYPENYDTFTGFFSNRNIGDVVGRAIPFVFAIAASALLIMIIAAGFTLLTSAGDTKKLEEGRQKLTYAILGFIVIFIAYWLVQLAGIITGIDFSGSFK